MDITGLFAVNTMAKTSSYSYRRKIGDLMTGFFFSIYLSAKTGMNNMLVVCCLWVKIINGESFLYYLTMVYFML